VQERLPHALDDLRRRGGADVSQKELALEFVEEVLVNPAAQAEQLGDAGKDAARPRQPLLEFLEQSPERHRRPLRFLCAAGPTECYHISTSYSSAALLHGRPHLGVSPP